MKRFGIDIDGTVTCPSSMVPFLNKAFDLNITLADIKQYDLTHLVTIPKQEFNQWFIENEAIIYEQSPLAEGAKQILLQWEKQFELYFISARSSHLLELTRDWFQMNGLPYQHIDLIGTHNKISTAKKYNVDIFFEDKHDNAVMIAEECKIPVLLFNTPYNQDPVPKEVVRVNNWYEASEWIGKWK